MSVVETGEAVAETSAGRVAGQRRADGLVFWGIPYAEPVGGAARWRAPQKRKPWAGVLEARERGLAAPQTAHFIQGFAASGPQGEDCLNLNVFTPALDAKKRPVLFWIHGGGYTHGAGYEPLYDGGPLSARGDVVVVTINYRLGALGFLNLTQIAPGAGYAANCGLLDQVEALRWVSENIAAFGGDPRNVTIFGESAGSGSVHALVASPLTRGLIRRAVLQSGITRGQKQEASTAAAEKFLAQAGVGKDLDALAKLDAAAILDAQTKASVGGPCIDPYSLPEDGLEWVRSGKAKDIPLLIGTNRDEVKLFAANRREEIDDGQLDASLQAGLPKAGASQIAGLTKLYRASRQAKGLPSSNLDIQDAINSDLRFRVNAMRLALAQVPHQKHTYVYLFTHASPARRGALGSCHALEMPFVFGTVKHESQLRFAGEGAHVDALSHAMMDCWLAFAKNGDPSCQTVGAWPAYEDKTRPTMIFDTPVRVENDPFGDERAALEALL
jgi:para-nitrobenzyl esterase